ncbi:MAG TPA: hypothetical protein VM532_17675 [Burkholderiales bacterium]|jgi:hypothetical protein|nr:hypothetical protein [Burkholderiales bacterium]
MSQETMDNLIGAAILVPFLILVFLAGRVLARFQGRRLSRSLEPLAPLVDGKVSSDGNNGFLVGVYGGRQVQVRICPKTGGLRGYSPHGTSVYNVFELEMSSVSGALDWTLIYGRPIIIGGEGWSVSADTPAFKVEVVRSEIVSLVHAAGGLGSWPVVAYTAKYERLTYSEDVQPWLAPPPERFAVLLDLMVNVADINNRINAAT